MIAIQYGLESLFAAISSRTLEVAVRFTQVTVAVKNNRCLDHQTQREKRKSRGECFLINAQQNKKEWYKHRRREKKNLDIPLGIRVLIVIANICSSRQRHSPVCDSCASVCRIHSDNRRELRELDVGACHVLLQ